MPTITALVRLASHLLVAAPARAPDLSNVVSIEAARRIRTEQRLQRQFYGRRKWRDLPTGGDAA